MVLETPGGLEGYRREIALLRGFAGEAAAQDKEGGSQ
jgi:hypothetical protein